MSGEAAKFFERFKDDLVGGLYTCGIGKIVAYDHTVLKADIELLPYKNLIKSVPVGMQQTGDFIVRMPYKKGDHVLVVFAHSEIDNIMYGGAPNTHKRMLSIDDAVVVCGINLYSNNIPSEHKNDMVIAKKDFSSKVVLDQSGNIIVESDKNVYLGGADASEGVPLGNRLKQWLDGHTHPISWSSSGGSGTSGTPTSNSPSPSGKVKTK